MILKVHSLLGNAAQLGKRKDLKPTAIGQNRPIPSHELVESTQLFDHLFTRTDMKVVGITQDDTGPHGTKLIW